MSGLHSGGMESPLEPRRYLITSLNRASSHQSSYCISANIRVRGRLSSTLVFWWSNKSATSDSPYNFYLKQFPNSTNNIQPKNLRKLLLSFMQLWDESHHKWCKFWSIYPQIWHHAALPNPLVYSTWEIESLDKLLLSIKVFWKVCTKFRTKYMIMLSRLRVRFKSFVPWYATSPQRFM